MVMCMNLQNVLFIVTASSAAARSISIIYRQDAVESEREGRPRTTSPLKLGTEKGRRAARRGRSRGFLERRTASAFAFRCRVMDSWLVSVAAHERCSGREKGWSLHARRTGWAIDYTRRCPTAGGPPNYSLLCVLYSCPRPRTFPGLGNS
jgi:hypothetical protein